MVNLDLWSCPIPHYRPRWSFRSQSLRINSFRRNILLRQCRYFDTPSRCSVETFFYYMNLNRWF